MDHYHKIKPCQKESIRKGNLVSRNKRKSNPRRIILEPGQRFGKLTVVKVVASSKGRTMYLVKCECGNSRDVPASGLKAGNNRTCGECGYTRKGEFVSCLGSISPVNLKANGKSIDNQIIHGWPIMDEDRVNILQSARWGV